MKTDSSYGQAVHPSEGMGLGAKLVEYRATRPVLTDVVSMRSFDPASTGFVLASLPKGNAPILWVQDRASVRENGELYLAGLRALGMERPVLQVSARDARDVLWAMEEGAKCAGLSAVIGEIHGTPGVLDFTATKRIIMRAEASGVATYLIRSSDPGTPSAARERWRVGSLPSLPHPNDSRSPGIPQWDLDLFRARRRPPGRWVAQYDANGKGTKDRFSLVSRAGNGTLGSHEQTVPDTARRPDAGDSGQ